MVRSSWVFLLTKVKEVGFSGSSKFDFFNISGALFVDQNTNADIRSSAQGLFMIMTNGFGATIGTLAAQAVVNIYVYNEGVTDVLAGWRTSWFVFAGYALVVLVLFAIVFRPKTRVEK